MKKYSEMTKEELLTEKASLEAQLDAWKKRGVSLNMARGKPSKEQLDLSMPMMDMINSDDLLVSEDGIDCRNYGELEGLPEAKQLMAEMMGTSADHVIVYGNASLNIMYDTIARSMTHGVCGSTPWAKLDKVKFLCPVPGYDRHFKITEFFGIEMINIPMTEDGPDMDLVEKYVNQDPAVKGIWCVPKFSNPEGVVYSEETVKRFAALKPAAEDFRIFWDNAYAVHYLYEEDQPELLDILTACEEAGNPDMVYEFASTSKVTFAGAGISAIASSKKNLDFIRKQFTVQTIGHDKLNQLRHVRFLKNYDGIMEQMMKHAEILRPKFEMVEKVLEEQLGGLGIGSWKSPKGGYFICFKGLEGTAKDIVAKAKECGVTLTGAGAPFPYGKDPEDAVIRIAPSFPTMEELHDAAEIFVLCVKTCSIDVLLQAEQNVA